MDKNIEIRTRRLIIRPFSQDYLEEYYRQFTPEITRYQYPESFPDLRAADRLVSGFVKEMEKGNMLELVILTPDGEFIGSLEVFGIRKETPEVGLWLKSSAHGNGYGYEALESVLAHLDRTEAYQYYLYEVDVRNLPSVHMVEKFPFEKGGFEELTTESGKTLKLQTYRVFPRCEGAQTADKT